MNVNETGKIFQSMLANGCSTYDLLRLAAHFRRAELEKKLHSMLMGQIADGPFKDMHYLDGAYSSTLAPKLLGTYEKEIQEDLISIAKQVECFLDIGCAEGYYTTGLALSANITSVIGVDIDLQALEASKKCAEINSVGNKCFFTTDTREALARLKEKSLIMIDVDGSEINVIKEIFAHCNQEILNAAQFIVETDYDKNRTSNKCLIIEEFKQRGFRVVKALSQDPVNRISDIAQNFTKSFLDLAVYGLEGRPADQCWLIFNKADS
jgi:precorrin-6B methylase 2